MEAEYAICPACKQRIEVNPSETIDFCKMCGKPFETAAAIKSYTDSVAVRQKNEENSREPQAQAVEKFYAILAQDYKLAERYLSDFAKKEYPELGLPTTMDYHLSALAETDLLFQKSKDYYRNHRISAIQRLRENVNTSESIFENLKSQNPCIAEMYYKYLCKAVNAFFNKNRDLTFTRWMFNYTTGELPYLKLRLIVLEDRLFNIAKNIDSIRKSYGNVFYDELIEGWKREAVGEWEAIEKDVLRYEHLRSKEFDDDYIDHVVGHIPHWANQNYFYGCRLSESVGEYIDDFLQKQKIDCMFQCVDDLVKYLEGFLSPVPKEKRDAERAKKEEAYKKETEFWTKYIELLKTGSAKYALAFLEAVERRTDVHRAEAAKFKKGLFGIKYTGYVSSLEPEDLAKRAIKSSGK